MLACLHAALIITTGILPKLFSSHDADMIFVSVQNGPSARGRRATIMPKAQDNRDPLAFAVTQFTHEVLD